MLEVTYKFPTGHFIQEVVKVREWDIIGVAKTNDDIQEALINIRKKKIVFQKAFKEFNMGAQTAIGEDVIKEFFGAT